MLCDPHQPHLLWQLSPKPLYSTRPPSQRTPRRSQDVEEGDGGVLLAGDAQGYPQLLRYMP